MTLYLQDYLEKLELLPDEIKNGFAAIKEIDLQVEDSMIQTSKRVDILFSKAESMNPDELQVRFKAIMEDGEKTIEKTENKIQIANRMQGLLSKYMKRLDDDLHSMKTELDANSSGITDIIEQSVLDSEQNNTINQSNVTSLKENKYHSKKCALGDKKKVSNSKNLKRKSTTITSQTLTDENVTMISQYNTTFAKSVMDLTIKSANSGSNYIESATSKAAIGTQQQLTQGRGQTNHKASFKMIKTGQQLTGVMRSASDKLPKEALINEELERVYQLLNPNTDKTTKQNDLKEIQNADTSTEEDVNIDESVSPDEPLYCICKNVAYGTMVACDNKECPSEWFHYDCVGIMGPPKGKWFCPQCVIKMKNRKSRK